MQAPRARAAALTRLPLIRSQSLLPFALSTSSWPSCAKLSRSALDKLCSARSVARLSTAVRLLFFVASPILLTSTALSLCSVSLLPFAQGDPANCFYIIAHGELKVSVKGSAKAAAAMGKATAAALADAEAKSGTKMRNGSTSGGSGSVVEMGAATNGGKRGSMAMLSPPTGAAASSNKRGSVVTSDGSAASGHQPQNSLSSTGIVDPVTGERELTRMGPGRYFGQ